MLLQQQCDGLVLLQGSWANPLASASRFRAHVASLATAEPIPPSLTWVRAIIRLEGEDIDAIQDRGEATTPPDNVDVAPLTSLDLLHGEDGEDNTLLLDYILDESDASNDRNADDDAAMTLEAHCVEIIWALPVHHCKDSDLLDLLRPMVLHPHPPQNVERVLYNKEFWVLFELKVINILSSPTHLLNDSCINGIANLLQQHFAAREPWLEEIKDVYSLVEKLIINANRNGKSLNVVTEEGWTARPLLVLTDDDHASSADGFGLCPCVLEKTSTNKDPVMEIDPNPEQVGGGYGLRPAIKMTPKAKRSEDKDMQRITQARGDLSALLRVNFVEGPTYFGDAPNHPSQPTVDAENPLHDPTGPSHGWENVMPDVLVKFASNGYQPSESDDSPPPTPSGSPTPRGPPRLIKSGASNSGGSSVRGESPSGAGHVGGESMGINDINQTSNRDDDGDNDQGKLGNERHWYEDEDNNEDDGSNLDNAAGPAKG
ncbi:hypothetical protein C0991_012343 [Blastosporella zonata]|nr:hypothetical protein C0991_012343 [Blastosporella zonata]